MLTKAPKGTKDIYGEEIFIWQHIEENIRSLCKLYNVSEIRTPIFEHTALFERSVGDGTDIVQKEMYTFEDKGGRSLSLRPEGTACVARSYIEHGMASDTQPVKLYYVNPTFRYEQPQSGRQRQFHQFGVEAFGSIAPAIDAEIISLSYELMKRLGLDNVKLLINSLGDGDERRNFEEALKSFIGENKDNFCKNCNDRVTINPLRVLDCKNEKCANILKDAPKISDFLNNESREHVDGLQKRLTQLNVPFTVDTSIVRGLDYYTKTVFEIVCDDLGAQNAICGGGRYDHMIKDLGGSDTPAFGFGLGIERLVLALKSVNAVDAMLKHCPEYYIIGVGENGMDKAFSLVGHLRGTGVSAECDLMSRSVKAQMKHADKIGAQNVVVIGDSEIESGVVTVKNMQTKELKEVALSKLFEFPIR